MLTVYLTACAILKPRWHIALLYTFSITFKICQY